MRVEGMGQTTHRGWDGWGCVGEAACRTANRRLDVDASHCVDRSGTERGGLFQFVRPRALAGQGMELEEVGGHALAQR